MYVHRYACETWTMTIETVCFKKNRETDFQKLSIAGSFVFRPHSEKCKLSQTSSLISQTLKLLPRIVVQRIGKKALLSNNKEQFASMSDRKTRNAISSLRFFAERKWEKTKSLDDTIHLLNRLQKSVWQRTTHQKIGFDWSSWCPRQRSLSFAKHLLAAESNSESIWWRKWSV